MCEPHSAYPLAARSTLYTKSAGGGGYLCTPLENNFKSPMILITDTKKSVSDYGFSAADQGDVFATQKAFMWLCNMPAGQCASCSLEGGGGGLGGWIG